MKKKLKSKQKKVQRRNKNISNFKTKLDIAREKNETDKEAITMYYEGIVDFTTDCTVLADTQSISHSIRVVLLLCTSLPSVFQLHSCLLIAVVNYLLKVYADFSNMTNYDINKIKLPGRTTAQRMVAEAGALVKI
jgi:hypothetical protein